MECLEYDFKTKSFFKQLPHVTYKHGRNLCSYKWILNRNRSLSSSVFLMAVDEKQVKTFCRHTYRGGSPHLKSHRWHMLLPMTRQILKITFSLTWQH